MTLTGPAVPAKHDVGGYIYDKRGVLIKNPVIKHKPTDFYDIPRGVIKKNHASLP